MIEFYPQIKQFHVFCALLSGTLFALRGACVLAGARWPHALAVRWFSWAVDTALLTAALMLFTLLPHAIFANGWLAAKLCLLVVYVLLGVFAMRRTRTRTIRAVCYAAALLAFAAIYGIARTHQPLGWLAQWTS